MQGSYNIGEYTSLRQITNTQAKIKSLEFLKDSIKFTCRKEEPSSSLLFLNKQTVKRLFSEKEIKSLKGEILRGNTLTKSFSVNAQPLKVDLLFGISNHIDSTNKRDIIFLKNRNCMHKKFYQKLVQFLSQHKIKTFMLFLIFLH